MDITIVLRSCEIGQAAVVARRKEVTRAGLPSCSLTCALRCGLQGCGRLRGVRVRGEGGVF